MTEHSYFYDNIYIHGFTSIQKYIPNMIHPNLLTISSILIINALYLSNMYYDPYYFSGSLLLYFLLDNIDGIHARATGKTSKLGEYLDHCGDGFIATLIVEMMSNIYKTELNRLTLCAVLGAFNTKHIVYKYTNNLSMGFRYFSVDENALLLMSSPFLNLSNATALYGVYSIYTICFIGIIYDYYKINNLISNNDIILYLIMCISAFYMNIIILGISMSAYIYILISSRKKYFIDGCFDGYHYGHVNAFLQAKNMCNYLVCGTHNDNDLSSTKGDSLLSYEERLYMLKHCRLIDRVCSDVPYITTCNTLDSNDCSHYVHGEEEIRILDNMDPLYNIKINNRYLTYPLTKGISTTQLIKRLYNYYYGKPIDYMDNSYLENILNGIRKHIPNNNNKIHYLYHSWDMLNSVHVKYLENYKKNNPDSKIIAIIDNDIGVYSSMERAIMLLSIREVDDIMISKNIIYDKIYFNKDKYIEELVEKIISNSNLRKKLLLA